MAIVTDKVLRFLEAKGYANRQEMIRALWRDATSEELDKIIATLEQGGIIYSYQQGRNTMYAVRATHAVGTVPSGTQSRKIKGVTP
jgi:metal-responsive CopG/Arc/MetJ family transcriptional regulator